MITIQCWSCGKSKEVDSGHPQFGFELAQIASEAGWIGVVDHYRARALVFCSDACVEAQKTKAGWIRLRPKKAAA